MDKLSELCRVCLATSKCLESLNTECEQGYSFKFMLTNFCTLQMDDISVMYDNICKDCSSEILRAYNFKLQCEQNDLLLRERARALKYDEVCKNEDKFLSEELELSIVKKEEENQYFYDENKSNVHVKEEDWMEGDDHRSSEDETLNNVIVITEKKVKTKTRKKEKKSSKSLKKIPATKVPTKIKKSVAKSKSEKKKNHTPEKETRLVDDSVKTLGYKRVYECPKCGFFFKLFSLIHKHLRKIHCIMLRSVEEFDEMWKARGIQESQEELKDVKKFDPKNPMYKCIECPHRCKDFEVMKKHIIEQHKEAKYIRCCEDNCQYSTNELRNLINHVKLMHKNERNYSCDKCDYRTHSRTVLDSHRATRHLNIKPFVCKMCTKAFVTNRNLKNHIAMKHEKNLQFFCPTCSKGFYVKGQLKEHIKIHLGLKPHICEHCGKAFTKKGNLDAHVFTSHTSTREDSVLCSECPYKAKNIYCLQSHISRIHRSKTLVYCDYCGKSFSRKSTLKIHIWKHMGWEPFRCSSCSYSCECKSRLQAHIMMKHTGERPFQCQFCNYGSVTQKQMTVHMESHLNEHKYKCKMCPYSANRRATLKKHQRTRCGTLTRKYTPYKNKAAIDFTQLNVGHLMGEVGEPSPHV